jgi:hypothetical protein
VVCGSWLVAVHDDAVATARLGRVQRAVGAGDKLIGGLAPQPARPAEKVWSLGVIARSRSSTSAACSVVASGRSRLNSSPP